MIKKLVIIIFSILSISLLFFHNGKIITNSDLTLNILPNFAFANYFLSWNDLLFLGTSSVGGVTYLFYGLLYVIFSNLFTIYIGQVLIFLILIFTGFLSFILLIQEEFPGISYEKYIGGVLYVFNMYTLLNFSGSIILLLPYFILPLQLFFISKILKSNNLNVFYILGFAISTLIMGGENLPFVGINCLTILFYSLHLFYSRDINILRIKSIIKISITIIITLLINLYWLIGILAFYLLMGGNSLQNVIGAETYAMDNMVSSYLNVFRTLGVWAFGGSSNFTFYYNYSSVYLGNPIFIISLFIIPAIVIFGIFRIKEGAKQYIYLIMLFIITLALEVGANQGFFKEVYIWIYNHIPYFAMFRNTYKFGQIYLFLLSFFLVIFLIGIKKDKNKILISFILLIIILVNAFPFFTGRIFEGRNQINSLPNYYYQAQKFFRSDQGTYRILLLPQQYFAEYTWGFTAGNPEVIWNKGLVVRQAGSALGIGNTLTTRLYKYLTTKQYTKFNSLLKELNIKYIVQRNDFAWYNDKQNISSPASVAEILKPYPKIISFGKLDIYRIPQEAESSLFDHENIKFKRISSVKYQIQINLSDVKKLNFLESFDNSWNLFSENIKDFQCAQITGYKSKSVECQPENEWLNFRDVKYLFYKPLFNDKHSVIYGYANTWIIDESLLEKYYPKNIILNKDGTKSIILTLYFKQQSYLYIGYIVSGFTLLVSAGYILIYLLKLKREGKII